MDAIKRKSEIDNEKHLEIFVFWLKISFGIIGGVSHYIIQRILFERVLLFSEELLRGLIVVISIFGFLFCIHILFYLIIRFSKNYFLKENQVKLRNWRLTLKFSAIFFTIFIISASLSYYIGF